MGALVTSRRVRGQGGGLSGSKAGRPLREGRDGRGRFGGGVESAHERSSVNSFHHPYLLPFLTPASLRRLEPRRRRPVEPGEDDRAGELDGVVSAEEASGAAEQTDTRQRNGGLACAGGDVFLEKRRRFWRARIPTG